MPWTVTSQAADSNNQHDRQPPQPRLRQPNKQRTTKAHDQNEDASEGEDEQDDEDTPFILSQLIDS